MFFEVPFTTSHITCCMLMGRVASKMMRLRSGLSSLSLFCALASACAALGCRYPSLRSLYSTCPVKLSGRLYIRLTSMVGSTDLIFTIPWLSMERAVALRVSCGVVMVSAFIVFSLPGIVFAKSFPLVKLALGPEHAMRMAEMRMVLFIMLLILATTCSCGSGWWP